MADFSMTVGNRLETQHLLSGRVKIKGFDVDFHNPGFAPAPTFNETVNKLTWDVAELTIANYIIAKDTGVPLIGLPVFPNVFFPLTGLTANRAKGIREPEDLAGRKIGVPLGFASNPAVWLRGILVHWYDVSAEDITWVEGSADSLRGIPYPRSKRFKSEKMADLDEALNDGQIDALIVAGGNSKTSPDVGLLLEDAMPTFEAFFKATNVFPINTLLVAKESTIKAKPAIADAVIAAANEAHGIYDAEEPDDGIHQGLRVGDMRKMGLFPRKHGLDAHGDSVRALVVYLYEQGLIKRLWKLEELFV
jgi:4,5-dihydroxyphthalate decarboxylase